jgi:hypothetical protein
MLSANTYMLRHVVVIFREFINRKGSTSGASPALKVRLVLLAQRRREI